MEVHLYLFSGMPLKEFPLNCLNLSKVAVFVYRMLTR